MPLWHRKGKNADPTRQDTTSPPHRRGPGRYLEIHTIDSRRARPFEVPPPPNREAVLRQVDQYVDSLGRRAVDEGTGAALDPIIGSWVTGWEATVETEYHDHCAVIHIHRGQAMQWLTDTTVLARHEREKLARIRADYLASRARLGGEEPQDSRAEDGMPPQEKGNVP